MQSLLRTFGRLALVLGLVAGTSSVARAQITTSLISGRVVGVDSAPIADVQVIATNIGTGAKWAGRTGPDGRYKIPNLNPGGPYTVTASRIGFKKKDEEGVIAPLGAVGRVDFVLSNVELKLSAVTVSADRLAIMDKGHTGPSTSVNSDMLSRLPTIARSLQDMTRLTPSGGSTNSFGGTSYRYNNVSIDGASTNDVFAFSASAGGISGQGPSGTPGAGARTQPISLDAISEVQVVLAPYDVKLGNFTGGSINAVTRSGANDFSGSIYSFGRNQSMIGGSADSVGSKLTSYKDYQFGGRLGGPIVKDKVFFFFSGEYADKQSPVGYAPGDAGTVLADSTFRQIRDTLTARYGYNSTQLGAYPTEAKNTKLFGRLDFNLSDNHKLNIRHNYLDASAQLFERAPFLIKFTGQDITQKNTTNSTVAELKSNWSGVTNNLIASFAQTNDGRSFPGQLFPQLEINGPSGSVIYVGSDREAAVWKTKTQVLELTDNVTWYKGDHTITLGSHNEFYNIDYNFLNAYNGRWQYGSIANFYANKPSRIRGQYDLTDDSYANVTGTPQAAFHVYWPSAYIQDEIAVTSNFTVTPGIRVDAPMYPDAIPVNPLIAADPNLNKYTNTQSTQFYVAPRISFNWDALGDQTLQVRGGTGIFMGRAPFAWLAYAYENTGLKLGNVDCRPSATSGCAGNSAVVPLVTDGTQLKTLQSGVYEANILDNNFKLPTVNRSSLGVDYRLPGGYLVTLEGMYTKNINDVKFLNVGLKDSTVASPVDGRPIFQGSPVQLRVNPAFTSVFLITNTNEGYRYNLTAQIRKSWKTGFDANVAYTYGTSKDIANGIRNSPQSNWEYNQVPDVRNPALAYSNFDIRHRVIATAGWTHSWSRGNTTGIQAVFQASSGSPFTFIYGSDANRDGTGNNDLIYVPRDSADFRYVAAAGETRTPSQVWQALNSFIKSQPGLDAARGTVAPRNTGRTPWNQQLDIRIFQDIPIPGVRAHSLQATLDLINLGAMLGTSWGRQYYVPNEENYNFKAMTDTKTDAVTGAPIGFNFTGVPNNTPWQYDNLTSRYQAQLGLRYSF